MSDDHSNSTTTSPLPASSESNDFSKKASSEGVTKLRVRRRKLSELAPWEIWRCVRCGKCYSKTSKAAILEHVRVLCQAGVHDDEEIRRQMAIYARKQGGWIYSGKKMGLANTYNLNNYTLAPFHHPFNGYPQPAMPFNYFPAAAPATPVNRYNNFQQAPLLSSTPSEPSNKRTKYDSSLSASSVKGTARSLSAESSSSSGSPGSRLSPISHLSQDTSRSTSNDNGEHNANSSNGNGNPPNGYAINGGYGINDFNYGGGGSDINYQNGYPNNYGMNYGYMNGINNYPFPQQNFNAAVPPVAAAANRRPTMATANEMAPDYRTINYPNGYNTINNFVPRNSPGANARY